MKGMGVMRGMILAGLAAGLLAGCGGGDGLRQFEGTGGPDEFSVQPSEPLIVPQTLSLPAPGGENRADIDPADDAAVALGGAPAVVAGGVPARDAALVSYAARNGVDANIRDVVAQEDANFRGRTRVSGLFNWFGGDRYFQTYSGQALDAYAELARFREAGIAVPSAPPAP